eukprot:354799-Chlamydomonas_euryale.AAC.5
MTLAVREAWNNSATWPNTHPGVCRIRWKRLLVAPPSAVVPLNERSAAPEMTRSASPSCRKRSSGARGVGARGATGCGCTR